MHTKIYLLFSLSFSQHLFIEKNNDALHASLEFLVVESTNPLLKRVFGSSSVAQPAQAGRNKKGKLAFISVGSKFRKQLEVLMEKLRSTVWQLVN